MRWFLAVILVMMFQVICLGQEKESVPDFKSDPIQVSTPRIKLEDYLGLTQSRYITRFEGLQGAVVQRTNTLFGKYERKYFETKINNSSLNPCEWDRLLSDYYLRSYEFQYGRWWERSYQDSLVPERGGVIYNTVVVGREAPVLGYDDVELMNTGKIRIGKLGLGLEQFRLPSASTVVNNPTSIAKQEDPPLSIRAFIPRTSYDLGWAKFSIYQNMTLRGSLNPEKILARLTVGVDGRFYVHGKLWAKLTIRANYAPMQDEFYATLWFELVTF